MSEWRSDKGAKTTCQDGYDPDQCPLCEERALFGAYLLGVGFAWASILARRFWTG